MPLSHTEPARVQANLNPSHSAKQLDSIPNPGNETQVNELDPAHVALYTGTVIESYPGTYACTVRIHGHNLTIPCTAACFGSNQLSGAGVGHTWLPMEGANVLVYKPDKHGRTGTIVAVLPPVIGHKDTAHAIKWVIPSCDPESGMGFATEAAYVNPYIDPNDMYTLQANGGRPVDAAPGSYALLNEMGIGMHIGTLHASFRASERAGVDAFHLDNLLRIYDDQFQHYSSIGEHHIYNDGGYQTAEFFATPHMCERFGFHTYGKQWLMDDDFDASTMKNSDKRLIYLKEYMNKRLHIYAGHNGGIFSMFVANPDPSMDVTQYDTKNYDQGLMSFNVDGSGRVMLSSAGDIILERTDRIPIPKKMFEPWDPEGSRVDTDDPYKEKKPYEWDDDEIGGNFLQIENAIAWYKKSLYQRFDEADKDWFTPEAFQLPVPDDDYEKIDKKLGTEHFSLFHRKRAFVRIGIDGTITMRSNGGSEIILDGKDIILNAPGDIRFQAGNNVVSLGRDIIQKSQNSIDISTTKNDIRIKSGKNTHMYAKEGMLLQSDGNGAGFKFEPDGEQQFIRGIMLHAKNSSISIFSKRLYLQAKEFMALKVQEASGVLELAANSIMQGFKRFFASSSSGGGLSLGSSASLFGKSASIVAEHSLALFRGTKAAVIAPWVDIGTDIYQDASEVSDSVTAMITESDKTLAPYRFDDLDKVKFKFRTPEQMHTNDIKIFEPYWMFVHRTYKAQLPWSSGIRVQGWDEQDVNATYPWPGDPDNRILYGLDEETNKTTHDAMTFRGAVKPDKLELTSKGMSEFQVQK